MYSNRNVPVYLEYHEDGTVSANCPQLQCQCKSPSHAQALRTMQQLVREASRKAERLPSPPRAEKYEIIFLAVARSLEECIEAARHLEEIMKEDLRDAS